MREEPERTLRRCSRIAKEQGSSSMLKGGLLWLIGIPLPVILVLYFMGYLH
jgi:hypothetical protein